MNLVPSLASVSAILCFLLLIVGDRKVDTAAGEEERVEVIPLEGGVTGPESTAFDADDVGPYTGVSDGRILVWRPEEHRWSEFAAPPTYLSNECRGSQDPSKESVCGRPLGLQFERKTGKLFIADAYLGLLAVDPGKKIASRIATEAGGEPFRFTNSLDIDQDSGIIYFTDSSLRFQRRKFMPAILSGDRTGRLLKYDPKSEEVEVLLEGLAFPNGVLLSHDGSFLLIAESTTCRILRFWLNKPNATEVEVVTELPGFPDNLKWSPRGGFWVGLHTKRSKLLKFALSLRWLTNIVAKIPVDIPKLASYVGVGGGKALALRLSEEGEVLQVLDGFGGKKLKYISEVYERNGSLWVGSVKMPFVGIYKL